MSPIAFSLWLLTWVTMATVVQGACLSNANFTSTTEFYANVYECLFPNDKLNKECVNASCPSLATSGECPVDSNGVVNVDSVRTQINKCFSSMTFLCGTGWNPLTVPQMSLGQSFLAMASFICNIPPGGAPVNGFQETTIDSVTSPGPYALSVAFSSPGIYITTAFDCLISAPLVPKTTFAFNGTFTRMYKGSADIALNANPPTYSKISFAGSSGNLTVGLMPIAGVSLSTTILDPLISTLTAIIANLDDYNKYVNSMAAYITLAIQVLRDNCPSD